MKTRTDVRLASRRPHPCRLQTELCKINSRSGGRSHDSKGWKRWKLVLPWLALLLSAQLSASAQPYAIDWFSIDGGGGTSTGGVYSVSATIGQVDAGMLSGGNFSFSGGFWSVFEPERPAPTLRIVRSGADVILSWEPSTPGFVLEMTDSLSLAVWEPAASSSTNPVAVPATGAAQFYRLRRQ